MNPSAWIDLLSLSFLKSSHTISYSKKALEKEKSAIEQMTKIEGLSRHLDSYKVRF
ncbi:MAG: histidinol dehydrogenase, partial [Actinobacteria bacterium]|nr:histidinol dehydrogenase [Actinomycetota bacterium]